jgi:hypothetical protein
MSDALADIGEFAEEVAANFAEASSSTLQNKFRLDVAPAALKEYVRSVYYASQIKDEGRYPKVCLFAYRGDSAPQFQIQFEKSVKSSPAEIAKLAHAVGSASHLCVITKDDQLLLKGIQVTLLDEMRHFGYSSFRPGSYMTARIHGPGHIEVSFGGIALVYKAGVIEEEKPLQYSQLMSNLAGAVCAELESRTQGVVESLEDVFNNLVKAIVRLGHGGLILFIKELDAAQFSSGRKLDCSLLGNLMVRYWDDVAALNSAKPKDVNIVDATQDARLGSYYLKIGSDTTMIDNGINSIARLAGMDGAIVLDHCCAVLAFNAIISKNPPETTLAQVVDPIDREIPTDELARHRGSRHQSAVAFVRRVPHSFAFVISQDGGVSAFHNQGNGKVVCERGLRVLE